MPKSSAGLADFIARQEEYIQQLEKESRYCRVSSCPRMTSGLASPVPVRATGRSGAPLLNRSRRCALAAPQGELTGLMTKLKDLISENEELMNTVRESLAPALPALPAALPALPAAPVRQTYLFSPNFDYFSHKKIGVI